MTNTFLDIVLASVRNGNCYLADAVMRSTPAFHPLRRQSRSKCGQRCCPSHWWRSQRWTGPWSPRFYEWSSGGFWCHEGDQWPRWPQELDRCSGTDMWPFPQPSQASQTGSELNIKRKSTTWNSIKMNRLVIIWTVLSIQTYIQ